MCEAGVPFLLNPDGSVFACADPSLQETLSKFLYLADRLPEYVVWGGFVLGLIVLLATALVVWTILS